MYPAVPGPCSVMRRRLSPSSTRGIFTAVPQSVNFTRSFVTSPARPRSTSETSRFFALRSRHSTRASFSASKPEATCSIRSSLTATDKGAPSAAMKSSKLP